MFHVQPEDGHYQAPKHVVVPYVENTLYSINKYSCVRRVHTLYISDYVRCGFACVTANYSIQRLQCMLCCEVFPNSDFKPSKLLEQFNKQLGGTAAGNTSLPLPLKLKGQHLIIAVLYRLLQMLKFGDHFTSILSSFIYMRKKGASYNSWRNDKIVCTKNCKRFTKFRNTKISNKLSMSNYVIRSRIKDMGQKSLKQEVEDINIKL